LFAFPRFVCVAGVLMLCCAFPRFAVIPTKVGIHKDRDPCFREDDNGRSVIEKKRSVIDKERSVIDKEERGGLLAFPRFTIIPWLCCYFLKKGNLFLLMDNFYCI